MSTPVLNIAISAARAAGHVIIRNINRRPDLKIQTKAVNDFVSEVDHQAEYEIISTIRKAYPHHAILAEESGQHEGKECEWIIDPLDGTANYIRGIPHYCVSIAMREDGKVKIGVVYDPVKEELFCAARGAGATLNNRRIRVSSHKNLAGGLIATGLPCRKDQANSVDSYMNTLRLVVQNNADIRSLGSAALDLAYVAAGRYDGFWISGLNSWDMAAGALLIQEAGGLVSDDKGGHNFMDSGNIVAANTKIYKPLITALNSTNKN